MNYHQAYRYYRRAANHGIVIAQFALSMCYDMGRGVTRDEMQAVYWRQKAMTNPQLLLSEGVF